MSAKPRGSRFVIANTPVRRGEVRDVRLKVSESFTGLPVEIPIRVMRAARSGSTVFVSAAVHGDELNGTGVIRELMFGEGVDLRSGTLLLMPAVNICGFENHVRYMPDRRDLNRCFPGSPSGSLTSRVANIIFEEVIGRCDYGIDLHSAAVRRTNFPNVRADLTKPDVRRLALAFGCELMVNSKGPAGSLRRTATRAGCPTITVEAGEPGKIEPTVLQIGMRGIRNVLIDLRMIDGAIHRPAYQTRVDRAKWVRAEAGGLLRFHVVPGRLVEAGQPIATLADVFGEEHHVLLSPFDGIVLGMTTFPSVKPGDPVCHLAIPRTSVRRIRSALRRASQESLGRQLRDALATNVTVTSVPHISAATDS